MTFFQLIAILTIIIILYKVIIKYKNKIISFKELLIWIIFWLSTTSIILNPEVTTTIANKVGIGRGADFTVYIGLLIVFYLLFKLFAQLDKLNNYISVLVEKIALLESKHNKK